MSMSVEIGDARRVETGTGKCLYIFRAEAEQTMIDFEGTTIPLTPSGLSALVTELLKRCHAGSIPADLLYIATGTKLFGPFPGADDNDAATPTDDPHEDASEAIPDREMPAWKWLNKHTDETGLVDNEEPGAPSLFTELPAEEPEEMVEADGKSSTPDEEALDRRHMVGLLTEGLLFEGEVLTWPTDGTTHIATVKRGGYLHVEGHGVCSTPTEAAQQVSEDKDVDGWSAWQKTNGKSLSDLNWMRLAREFPPPDSTSEIYRAEKCRIARQWVECALKHNLDPGQYDEDALNACLSSYRYLKSTISAYRSHLDDWFEQFSNTAEHIVEAPCSSG